jgi:hypothetical protein
MFEFINRKNFLAISSNCEELISKIMKIILNEIKWVLLLENLKF